MSSHWGNLPVRRREIVNISPNAFYSDKVSLIVLDRARTKLKVRLEKVRVPYCNFALSFPVKWKAILYAGPATAFADADKAQ